MPRQARKKCDSGIYHVMLRGNDRTTIFHDDEDCERFLWILRKCLNPPDPGKDPGKQGRFLSPGEGRDGSFLPSEGKDGSFLPGKQGRFLSPTACDKETVPLAPPLAPLAPAQLFAYCLMGNHVHLLLREGSEELSHMMKRIGIRFAAYYQWKYQHTGHVFQDRFRSEPVETDDYFLAVFRYIVLNPVKAGIAGQAGDWPWCSYRPGGPGSTGTGRQGRFLSPGEGRDGSFPPGKQGRFLSPTACDKETVPLAPLPMDISPEELEAFILSRQVELHPFRERLSDREAEAVLLQVTGLQRAGDFVALSKAEQRRLFSVLYENDLTVPQIARLTGVPKSNIARWV